ncbi:MAG: phosphoenolpyruvate synthase [Oligoflexia bacterium]|nr:phosphoenolpyruvate synthase [Oligoflexia bacterium]
MENITTDSLVGQKLTLEAFQQLCGEMAGYPYVKIVVERDQGIVHFINDHKFKLHAKYIGKHILDIPEEKLLESIDDYNKTFYYGADRKFYLGILSLVNRDKTSLFALETVEVDDMDVGMLQDFFQIIKENLISNVPLYLKPANYEQESAVESIPEKDLPRLLMHELMLNKSFIPLNNGKAKGRIRIFESYEDYKEARDTIKWHDIIVMNKVPENIPRVAGIINGEHTAPLSHTNVLANGWGIPNAIQIDAIDDLLTRKLNKHWVEYEVQRDFQQVRINEIDQPADEELDTPNWFAQKVLLKAPEIEHIPIKSLNDVRMSESVSYGTKAANIGEVNHILNKGSQKLTGFYQIERYPRPHLMEHLAKQLNVSPEENLKEAANQFVRDNISVPRGICIPFSVQQKFLAQSPQIQQTIGKLKMALELNAKEVDSLCIQLQQIIRKTPISDGLWEYIDGQIAEHLSGAQSFVVRSSSNAEDLEHFSAAGIYESYNHVTSAEKVVKSIKEVWASLVSPRSVRLRQEVGISLDDCYMGVVIQEEIKCDLGGVLVTTNPLNPKEDYRNVYINASSLSPNAIVEGASNSSQFLFNIVEGGGRTIVREKDTPDLSLEQKGTLKKLALIGKLLQSHFSPDYTYKLPADIEWAISGNKIYLLQIRPYSME